jgi:hypothetical protein
MDIDMGSDIVIEESDVDIKEEDMNLWESKIAVMIRKGK